MKDRLLKLYQNGLEGCSPSINGVLNAVTKGLITTEDAISIIGEERELDVLRSIKLTEISAACSPAIAAGFDITLSDGAVHHFSLEETDQINLSTATMAVQQGAAGSPRKHRRDGDKRTVLAHAVFKNCTGRGGQHGQ